MQVFYCTLLLVLTLGASMPQTSAGQDTPSLYYRNFVEYADGSEAKETDVEATFTAYLNGDMDTVLVENAPRWDGGGDPNLAGDGTFGVELSNFPNLSVGDTVHVRYTSFSTGQQGTISQAIPAIPWDRFPQRLTLEAIDLPPRPANVDLSVGNDQIALTWTVEAGVTYSIYRRTIQDTLDTGASRNLYVRVAEGLTAGSFTDTDVSTELDYGYILYAHSEDDRISAHSKEARETQQIAGLTAIEGATNVSLQWEPYEPALGTVEGYTIYRREVGGSFDNPPAYTGREPVYVDSRLEPGTNYEYQVHARIANGSEEASSQILSVTTNTSEYYTYASIKAAVVVYQNTNYGSITDAKLAEFKRMLELARLFYWRNSGLKFNVEFTYYPITSRREFASKEGITSYSAHDLDLLGVVNTQYDLVFVISPATEGYWSWGVTDLALPGPSGQTGFSQTQYPYGTGVEYPGHEEGIDYGLTWIFTHEAGHAIDAIYNASGHPEMAHGDQPWLFDVPSGEHFDFQAQLFRSFKAYEDLAPRWGDIYEAVDSDGDGFPDDDPRVPLSELDFGSSPENADTDDDGLSDRDEATDGSFSGSDPVNPDTDGDGVPDGADTFPRYAIESTIPEFTPLVDGTIEEGWSVANDTVSYTQSGYAPRLHLAYDPDSLYLALDLPNIGIPEVWFDFGSDGFWHGRGNTMMRIDLTNEQFSVLRSRDGSPAAREYSESGAGLWDDESDYARHFGSRIFTAGMMHLEVNLTWPRVQIELAIPRREEAGLTLERGDSVGLIVRYHKVNNQPSQWATTFDLYHFVPFLLGDASVSTGEALPLPDEAALEDVYPNPSHGDAFLVYSLDATADVELHVYDVAGRRVRTLKPGQMTPGRHEVTWKGRTDAGPSAASGVYFVRLLVDGRPVDGLKLVHFSR